MQSRCLVSGYLLAGLAFFAYGSLYISFYTACTANMTLAGACDFAYIFIIFLIFNIVKGHTSRKTSDFAKKPDEHGQCSSGL